MSAIIDIGAPPVASDSTDVNLTKPAEPPARVGRNDLGRINVGDRVVEKIASQAAFDIADAGGAAVRLLGRPLPGAGRLGIRGSSLTGLPKVTADVDGELGFLHVELSVRWPAPVGQVTEEVRQHLFNRLRELTGLNVREVNIDVVALIGEAPAARVS